MRRPAPAHDALAVTLGRDGLALRDVIEIAHGKKRIVLDATDGYRELLGSSVDHLNELLRSGKNVYGVTTGVGASVENGVSSSLVGVMPSNLVRLHGCGTGQPFDETETAAIVVSRLASLARGYSAVRPEVLSRLCEHLNRGVLPVVPSEGSVGASGDLTPLSYVAAAIEGEREVWFRGEPRETEQALGELGLEPLQLAPKESLAIMNGTSAMTGLACLAHHRAERLARLACSVTALVSDAVLGNAGHFDPRIFQLKPHPGQTMAAAWIRDALGPEERRAAKLQDPYSIRCAPHVVGVLLDGLGFAKTTLEIELNGVNDNPIVPPDSVEVLHGGNFYGGHVAFVMDALKIALASVADLLDRQVALLCNPATNNGLPADLVALRPSEAAVHHGFKAMQITASALAAEALKLTMPATSFSRSTESHNQDKVSMGTIAARDCLRVVELAETVAIVALLAACQARDLRRDVRREGSMQALHDAVRRRVAANLADRRQDVDIAGVLDLLRGGELPVAGES